MFLTGKPRGRTEASRAPERLFSFNDPFDDGFPRNLRLYGWATRNRSFIQERRADHENQDQREGGRRTQLVNRGRIEALRKMRQDKLRGAISGFPSSSIAGVPPNVNPRF